MASEINGTHLAALAWDEGLRDEESIRSWLERRTRDEILDCAARWVMEQVASRGRRETRTVERDEVPTPRPATRRIAPDPTVAEVELATQATDQALSRLRNRVNRQVAAHAKRLTSEWSDRIRAQRIALPDGRTTTWGAASLKDHAERADMFEGLAASNAEGAARHRRAIADCAEAGVETLDALVALRQGVAA